MRACRAPATPLTRSARVQYVLGTDCLVPPAAHEALLRAIAHYLDALRRTQPHAAAEPSALHLDVLSNLAFALQSLGELLDAFAPPAEASLGDALLAAVRRGADAAPALAALATELAPDTPLGPTSLHVAAASVFAHTAAGQLGVLQASAPPADAAQGAAAAGGGASPPPAAAPDPGAESPGADAYTASLVCPASYLESLGAVLSSLTALLAQASTPAALELVHAAAQDTLARAEAYDASLPPGYAAAQSPENEWDARVAELRWAQLSVRVAAVSRAAELARSSGVPPPDARVVEQLEQDVRAAADEVVAAAPAPQSLTAVRLGGADADAEPAVGRLCDVADHAHTLARMRLAEMEAGTAGTAAVTAAVAARAWDLAASASRCLLAAVAPLEPAGKGAASSRVSSTAQLALPHAPMAWVRVRSDRPVQPVGTATNTSTRLSRMRASIYAELANLALTRSDEALLATHAAARDAHMRLLDNARVYARRALVEQGLEWAHHVRAPPPPAEEPETMLVYGRALAHAPPEGGWESVAQDADLLLGCVRAVYLRGARRSAAGDAGAASSAGRELDALAGAAWSLLQLGPPAPYRQALDPAESVQRVLEGERASAAEQQFWGAWATALHAKAPASVAAAAGVT